MVGGATDVFLILYLLKWDVWRCRVRVWSRVSDGASGSNRSVLGKLIDFFYSEA